MKRTISEVIDLIKQKKENAESNLAYINNLYPGSLEKMLTKGEIIGTIKAYTDILALLESSHLVEQEKAIDILKEHITCKKCNVSTEPDIDEYEYYIESKHPITRNSLDEKEYEVLSGVFKDNE